MISKEELAPMIKRNAELRKQQGLKEGHLCKCKECGCLLLSSTMKPYKYKKFGWDAVDA